MYILSVTVFVVLGCVDRSTNEDPGVGLLEEYRVGSRTDFLSLTVGNEHACGLTEAGEVDCWGCSPSIDDTGEYWGGADCDPPEGSYSALSSLGSVVCTLNLGGALGCFGSSTFDSGVAPSRAFEFMEVGEGLVCGITPDGTVHCYDWSYDEIQLSQIPSRSTSLSVGEEVVCVMNSQGHPVCDSRRDRTLVESYVSDQPDIVFEDFRLGVFGTCGREQGTLELHCWGSTMPTVDIGLVGAPIDYDLNYWQGCAVGQDGRLSCWGWGDAGPMPAPDGEYERVWVGSNNSCALRRDRRVVCWGSNGFGQSSPP